MPAPTNLDMDMLRSLVALVELGSLSRAAQRLGRGQSALSLRMKRLEEQTGQALFRRDGRGLVLTETGELLLGYARRILTLNDEAVAALQGSSVAGTVRFGTSQDFAETWLPRALARFARAHPAVRIEARIDGSVRVAEAVERGRLDLALALGQGVRPKATVIGHLPLVWIARRGFVREVERPLPLVVFEPPCRFRQKALAVLDDAGIPWRIVFTSPSLSGLWAAVGAGLGVTIRTPEGLPAPLAPLDAVCGLPELGSTEVSLHRADGARRPAVDSFLGTLQAEMPAHLRILKP